MKIFVSPSEAINLPFSSIEDSSVLTDVVPTAITRFPSSLASLIILAVSSGIRYFSLCILWFNIFSTCTGRNVPSPTSKNTSAIITPFSWIFSKSSFVKWSPAVGAATDSPSLA